MTDLRLVNKKAAETIDKSTNILLVTSPPDGDSIGSALAFSRYLDQKGKRHRIFCKSKLPQSLMFLPGSENISADTTIFQEKRFDCIVVFDAGDLKYAGIDTFLAESKFPRPFIICFDHHSYSQFFGDINAIDQKASSTTQVIYNFFHQNGVLIDKEMATCLLTGILTDTGAFSNPATTFQSLEIAAELLKSGVRFSKVAAKTLKNKSINTLRLWGEALNRLRLNPDFGIATTVITQADFERFGASEEEVEGIANFLNSLDGVRAVLVLKEMSDGKVKGSFRTSQEGVDVSRLAVAMGGGGHKKAAGFTVPIKLTRTETHWTVSA